MARHHARELALQVLFEHDVAKVSFASVLERTLHEASPVDGEYARILVEGTVSHQDELDAWIEAASRDWHVGRMPPIDRNILRLACYEMAHEAKVPLSVVIDEALELAQDYSTVDAKRFVNGVLGTIAQRVRPEGDPDRPNS
ncbi:MAG: transcription antitermination factor NusB [Sulfobacillus acidophilus]|uniref:Transcription antitermination protein NusB n=1 Tax=Sulfobacillus acidophilus TaxID=53633 RepID=A0A2T2WPJ2_9FIRM|nr:MAG: transcription antitermination factor NusB [Sulfobacillus acidophilus]